MTKGFISGRRDLLIGGMSLGDFQPDGPQFSERDVVVSSHDFLDANNTTHDEPHHLYADKDELSRGRSGEFFTELYLLRSELTFPLLTVYIPRP